MKKVLITSLVAAVLPLASIAQDDMYFSPKKDKKVKIENAAYANFSYKDYPGCNRDVDEYNRRGKGSPYQMLGNDSSNIDVIDFYGVTPDSIYGIGERSRQKRYDYAWDEDYDNSYSYRMRHFDDFWFYAPWFYDSAYYSPWYGYYCYGWRRPWNYGWYDPWYDYWGWNHPYWGPAIVYRYNGNVTGTSNHGWVGGDSHRNVSFSGNRGNSNFSGYRGSNSKSNKNVDAYNRQTGHTGNNSGYRRNNSFGNEQNRQQSINYDRNAMYNNNSPYRNNSSFGSGSSVNSGSSFGGGGGFSGGSGRSGGCGHFGGRR